MIVANRVEAGDVLHLRLCNRAHLCVHDVALRVIHWRGGAGGPWLVGGMLLDPLPPGVLHALFR